MSTLDTKKKKKIYGRCNNDIYRFVLVADVHVKHGRGKGEWKLSAKSNLDRDVTDVGDIDVPGLLVRVQPERVPQPFGPDIVVGIGQREICRAIHDGLLVNPDHVPLVGKDSSQVIKGKVTVVDDILTHGPQHEVITTHSLWSSSFF